MKAFFISTAALEVGAGLALVGCPLEAATLLLGMSPNGSEAVVIERIAGFALIALALANWLARNDTQSAAARGIIWGMIIYNLGVFAVLLLIVVSHPRGALLWPAVILHTIMGIWCGLCLAKKSV